jgi:hypothetical protein
MDSFGSGWKGEQVNLPRDSKGKLLAWSDVGLYPIFYMDTEGSILCPKCARLSDEDEDEVPQFKPIAADVNWEDRHMYCDDCSERIESAYAED